MSGGYFNTTGVQGQELSVYETVTKSQEELILDYFGSRPGMEYSPSQVRKYLNLTGVPITSVRRAITNLTSCDLLRKTSRKVDGPYGRPECCWTLRRYEPEGQLELLPVPGFQR